MQSGWYPDPTLPNGQRYWDGRQWHPPFPGQSQSTWPAVLKIVGLFAVVALAAVFLFGFGNGGSSGGGRKRPAQSAADARTCGGWLTLSDDQKDAGALVLVQALDARDQSQSFADDFASDITQDCQTAPGSLQISDVAAGIATLDTTDFPR